MHADTRAHRLPARHLPLQEETWEGIAASGKYAVKDQRGRVIWKTTTAHGESSKPLSRCVGGG